MGGCATKPKEFDDSHPGPLPSDAPVSSNDKQPAFDVDVTPAAHLDQEKDNSGEKQDKTPLVDLSEPKQPKVQECEKETPAFDEPVSAESAAAVNKVETNVIASRGKIDDPDAKKPDAKEKPAFEQPVSAESVAVVDKVETDALALDGKIEAADAQKLEAKEKPPSGKPISAESAAAGDKVATNAIASDGKIEDADAKKPEAEVKDKADEHNLSHKVLQHFQ